jgi:hypothetical protein
MWLDLFAQFEPVFDLIVRLGLITVSAFAGAAALLLLQTLHTRIRFLRGLEEELDKNLILIGRIGIRIEEEADPYLLEQVQFQDHVYRAVQTNDPILLAKLETIGISPLTGAYQRISFLKRFSVAERNLRRNDTKDILKILAKAENDIQQSAEHVVEYQQKSWLYRIYNRVFYKEDLEAAPSRIKHWVGGEGGISEEDWRPDSDSDSERAD